VTAPALPRVVLRCVDAGVYEVALGVRRWSPPVLVVARTFGWDVLHTGAGVGGHPSFAAVRVWLESAAGRAWLAQLPRDVR
jgi:hypothetical protein